MLNHIRTLLLNRTIADPTALVPELATVKVPGWLAVLDSTLFTNEAMRQRQLDAYTRIIHTPELETYTLAFDPRITYDLAKFPTLAQMCAEVPGDSPAIRNIITRLEQVFNDVELLQRLFNWPEYQSTMDVLRTAYHQSPDYVLRLGAVLLAYAYQLERTRLNRG